MSRSQGRLPSSIDELEVLRQRHAELCRGSLPTFFRAAWRVLEPETELLWNWHHALISEYLTAVRLGEITRLIINIAPRTTKSLMSTVCFPCWWWVAEPHTRFLFGSFAGSLATKHSVLRRNLIESEWYTSNFGQTVRLTTDTNMKTEFANTATGFMKAAGVKAGVLGSGADCIVLDDPQDPKGAESDLEREATLNAIDLSWSTRLNDKKRGKIVVVMQRLHCNDVTAHLLAKESGWVHVSIPTIAPKKTTIIFPRSKRELDLEEGELLHPEREGAEEIERARKDLGSFGFAGQYQQSPVPREGAIVKIAWLKYWKDRPESFDQLIQSWDLAFKGTETSDFVVGQVLGRKGGEIYLVDQVRGRWNFPETLAMFRALTAKYPQALLKLVEARANGDALIDTLKKEIPGILGIVPRGTKEERLSAVTPVMECGNYFVPDPSVAAWIKDYVEELTTFPKSTNKDQVDATSQGISKLLERKALDFSPISITKTSMWRMGDVHRP